MGNHMRSIEAGSRDRVYGPSLMLEVCASAAQASLPIFLLGSDQAVLDRLRGELESRFPELEVAGAEPSAFRRLSEDVRQALLERIGSSGAAITFVGLGCPR
jgi:exopolysaccharide biosynthesis WecB/TagA/CpsF family protein